MIILDTCALPLSQESAPEKHHFTTCGTKSESTWWLQRDERFMCGNTAGVWVSSHIIVGQIVPLPLRQHRFGNDRMDWCHTWSCWWNEQQKYPGMCSLFKMTQINNLTRGMKQSASSSECFWADSWKPLTLLMNWVLGDNLTRCYEELCACWK